MQTKYTQPRGTRSEGRTIVNTFRGGKLVPIMAVPFEANESGSITQQIHMELDAISGRMVTEITGEVIAVFVPIQAVHALLNPEHAYPGNTEVVRDALLAGAIFPLEDETDVSKRLGVQPISIAGDKKLCSVSRLAYNAAVNHLRLKKYREAELVEADNAVVTPALISNTVLDRLNAVLDPEDRVNGAVSLSGNVVVKGLGIAGGKPSRLVSYQGTEGEDVELVPGYVAESGTLGTGDARFVVEEDPDNLGHPKLYGEFGSASDLSLTDFYTAEKMDAITRAIRQYADANPEYSDDIVARYAHGLSVDVGRNPFVIYEKQQVFGMGIRHATDGASLDTSQTDLVTSFSLTVPVPATELGGLVITMACVKPDEAISSQPHPILSKPWGLRNHAADELAIDPVPVTIRELNADCDVGDEETVALYIGNNGLLKNYVNYGLGRNLDPTTVENQTAIWQLDVPMSVTPQSVLYPDDLDHYPFQDQLAEVCTYTIASRAVINTPTIMGPTPVEELAAIETENVFEDAE